MRALGSPSDGTILRGTFRRGNDGILLVPGLAEAKGLRFGDPST